MSDSSTPVRKTPPPPQVIAEAGVWVARLNGPNCEPARKGLRRWLAESKTHQQAFELATDVWEEAGALRGCAAAHLTRVKPPGRKAAYAGAAMAVAAALVIGAILYLNQTGVMTGVGEQRQLTLEDGSRVLLNTSTHIVVKYDQYARRIELENGEALFDVMKNPRRPFVVTAGGREVTALGTSFNVRRDGPQVTVTLLEGKVTVAAIAPAAGAAATAPAEVEVLRPGQRLTFAAGSAPHLDRPPLQRVTDWQRGRVSLDDVSLADAVAEMNRYSIVKLSIERPEAAAVHVSGTFRAGDSMSFARAVSQTYGLKPIEQANAVLLTGVPEQQASMATPAESPDAD